ncbi:MAG TPA: CrcB family protein [Solirubrobacteraceae bacterium]|nr:CrcB family protein [Solirubrobacteraceae bacterium]
MTQPVPLAVDAADSAERVALGATVAQARVAAIAIGGAAGTLARMAMADVFPPEPRQWPWATFIVNLVGALLLGWVLTCLARQAAPNRFLRPFIATGFCGALTTFSALQIETLEFARGGPVALAVGYPLTSLAAGLAAALAGVTVARRRRQ